MARSAVHWTLLIVTAPGGYVRTFHTTRHAAPAWPASFLPRTVLYSSMYMSRSLAALHSCSHDGPLAAELTLSHEVKCVGLVMPHACTRHLPSGPQPPSHHRTRSLNENFSSSSILPRTPTFAHRTPQPAHLLPHSDSTHHHHNMTDSLTQALAFQSRLTDTVTGGPITDKTTLVALHQPAPFSLTDSLCRKACPSKQCRMVIAGESFPPSQFHPKTAHPYGCTVTFCELVSASTPVLVARILTPPAHRAPPHG